MYERWNDLQSDSSGVTKEEVDWTTTELRNGLRSIEWDLEDLEETVGIVEGNPRKFKLDDAEIGSRRRFITETRDEVALMRDHVADSAKSSSSTQSKRNTVASLMNSGLNSVVAAAATGNNGSTKYSKLSNESDSPSHNVMMTPQTTELMAERNVDIGQHRSLLLRDNDRDEFNRMEQNLGTLKNMSNSIGRETEEHSV